MEVLLLLLFCIFVIVALFIILCKCDRRSSEYRYSSPNNLPTTTTVSIEEVILYPNSTARASPHSLPLKSSPTEHPVERSPSPSKNEISYVSYTEYNSRMSADAYPPESVRQYPSHRRTPYPTDPEMTETSSHGNFYYTNVPHSVRTAPSRDDLPPAYTEAVQSHLTK